MGMSDDLEAAITEGATMVRVGRAIFRRTRNVAGAEIRAIHSSRAKPCRRRPH
jgi:hypothetical protein